MFLFSDSVSKTDHEDGAHRGITGMNTTQVAWWADKNVESIQARRRSQKIRDGILWTMTVFGLYATIVAGMTCS